MAKEEFSQTSPSGSLQPKYHAHGARGPVIVQHAAAPEKSKSEAKAGDDGGASMALRITERDVGGVAVVDLDGRSVIGEESKSLREKLKGLLEVGKKKIVLNLQNISYIDSTGLGTLVSSLHSAQRQGAMLKLANLGMRTKEILEVTKLTKVFNTYDSEARAASSFE
jgi:anti-sigma B factor antagonist